MPFAPQEIRTYFTTFGTAGRREVFKVHANADLMISTVMGYRAQGKFTVHAFVIMPDHVHVLLTPAPEVSLEKAIQLMKGGFSFRLKSNFDVWERGHFDRRIKDQQAYEACVAYIHNNPIEKHMVAAAREYAFSSANVAFELDPRPAWLG